MRVLAVLVLVAGCGGGSKGAAPGGGDLDAAIEACARGDLDAAERLAQAGRGPEALRLRARILMMRNRNREAIDLLVPLLQGKATDYAAVEGRQMVLPDLALAYLREDNFLSAARVNAHMGETLLARKYEALSKVVAYAADLPDNEAAAEFFISDPLPVVTGTVNGRRCLFVIDTLLDQVVLDRAFARSVGVEGIAKEIGLGRAVIRNVPVNPGEARQVGTLKPDGVIGLQFLMHFDFTIDYRRSRLVLRRAGGVIQGQPAYLVGDRYLLTAATVNGKDRTYAALGTGLAGVTLAGLEPGDVREFATGAIKLVKPSIDVNSFPPGLQDAFQLPVSFVLGHAALRGRSIRLEPRSMRLSIE